jgi:hypothetical protein
LSCQRLHNLDGFRATTQTLKGSKYMSDGRLHGWLECQFGCALEIDAGPETGSLLLVCQQLSAGHAKLPKVWRQVLYLVIASKHRTLYIELPAPNGVAKAGREIPEHNRSPMCAFR